MDSEKPNQKPPEHIDKELESLLEEVKDPLPTGDAPKPVLSDPKPVLSDPKSSADPLPGGGLSVVKPQEPEENKIENDIKVILNRFHDVTDKILKNFDDDRDEVEDTIDRLRDMMMSSNKPPSFVVEGLVSALKTKSDTNSNIIKMLDAFAKIISSTKNTNIQQNTSIDLSSLLANDDQ